MDLVIDNVPIDTLTPTGFAPSLRSPRRERGFTFPFP